MRCRSEQSRINIFFFGFPKATFHTHFHNTHACFHLSIPIPCYCFFLSCIPLPIRFFYISPIHLCFGLPISLFSLSFHFKTALVNPSVHDQHTGLFVSQNTTPSLAPMHNCQNFILLHIVQWYYSFPILIFSLEFIQELLFFFVSLCR